MTGAAGATLQWLALPLVLAGGWFAHLYRSGWLGLTLPYRAATPYVGPRWRYRSGMLGNSYFSHTLVIGSSQAGLYLAVAFPFGTAYEPLLIPWGEVAVSLKKAVFFEYWEFHFGDRTEPTLKVGKRFGQRIIQASLKG